MRRQRNRLLVQDVTEMVEGTENQDVWVEIQQPVELLRGE